MSTTYGFGHHDDVRSHHYFPLCANLNIPMRSKNDQCTTWDKIVMCIRSIGHLLFVPHGDGPVVFLSNNKALDDEEFEDRRPVERWQNLHCRCRKSVDVFCHRISDVPGSY
ncbi:uncharacterized protein PHALS_05653 [Plasmopara halstedii]|uniref:Uncharacterized protein n=1 Tax=Plasmopara halstedii TaxID=4781 RepID=A0A0P1B1T7_PLAHL|nr:uncharacterized protein PHALS_05653 [Plasmopara halstedii]CEG48183.1 hypothetical protein PHALS_05653 [Plasmopara halstedii]|eukprot:XP_024584552.1 hypothetical protein PHALS_05653 [Plasmopara halstedii]